MDSNKIKAILVTGSAGFIGSVVCRKLLDEGKIVVGIDNLNDYYSPELKQYRLDNLIHHSNFYWREVDIGNRVEIEEIFDKYKISEVMNLAARAGVRYSKIDPYIYMQTNVNGTLNILEQMRKYGIKKMVLASTSSLYAGSPLPYNEELPVNKPLSPYAASKKAAEAICYSYHHLYQMDITVVRYFTVYGPAGRPDMSYFRFINWIEKGEPIQLYGDGEQARDFTYVTDIASGTIKALDISGYEIINLGGGKDPVSILDMIKMLEEMVGKKAVIKFLPEDSADMKITWADIDKADKLLNWRPKVLLRDGLQNCVDWYYSNRKLAEKSLEVLK